MFTMTACVHIGEEDHSDHDHAPGEHVEEIVEQIAEVVEDHDEELHEDENHDDHEDEVVEINEAVLPVVPAETIPTINIEEVPVAQNEPALEVPVEVTASESGFDRDAIVPVATPGEVFFTISGGNYYYDINDITVKEGDIVTINFRSEDGFHDWVIDEFDAATNKISTGQDTNITFTADKKGTFEFYCSVGNHRAQGMVGTLTVE